MATRARATSETTRRPRSCCECLPAEPLRPPCLSASFRSARAVCRAGAIPEITQATTHSNMVKAKISAFISISSAMGNPAGGTSAPSACAIHIASGAPTSPPIRARIRLSVRSCMHQPAASRSQREPYAELLVPRRDARQQQVGHIRADDQQHHAAHRHQDL